MEDVEKVIIDYINSKVDTSKIYCADKIPNPRPNDKVITVSAQGSVPGDYTTVDSSTIAIQTYAPSSAEAYSLARYIYDILFDVADEDNNVASISVGTPYNWTDREPRYQIIAYLKTV